MVQLHSHAQNTKGQLALTSLWKHECEVAAHVSLSHWHLTSAVTVSPHDCCASPLFRSLHATLQSKNDIKSLQFKHRFLFMNETAPQIHKLKLGLHSILHVQHLFLFCVRIKQKRCNVVQVNLALLVWCVPFVNSGQNKAERFPLLPMPSEAHCLLVLYSHVMLGLRGGILQKQRKSRRWCDMAG